MVGINYSDLMKTKQDLRYDYSLVDLEMPFKPFRLSNPDEFSSPGSCCCCCCSRSGRPGNERRGTVQALDKKITEEIMDKKVGPRKEKPDPERMAVLRGLPVEIKQQITGEEAQAFLYKEELPESLLEKLRDYLVPEEK